jgi:hypothetical protein
LEVGDPDDDVIRALYGEPTLDTDGDGAFDSYQADIRLGMTPATLVVP